MILFIDGRIIVTTVKQNIDLYYQTYLLEFDDISRTQWEGSQEYEIAYANAQRDHQNAVIFQQTLARFGDSIANINNEIKRPAVLHSRVSERFAEAGFIGTIRQADDITKGVVAIAVDYTSDSGGVLDTQIAELIAFEMLPAGQHMVGAISKSVALSNGQAITVQWAEPVQHDVVFNITLTVDPTSQHPVDNVDTIVARFLENFNEQNRLGNNITPASYYQIAVDAPWSSEIVTTYELDASGMFVDDIYYANYDDKFNGTLVNADVTIVNP